MRNFIVSYSILLKNGSSGFGSISFTMTQFPNPATITDLVKIDKPDTDNVVVLSVIELPEKDFKSYQSKESYYKP